jgi:DNA polymerase III delta subunit
MLYIYYGTDIKKILNNSQKLIEALKTKREFAQVFYFYPENFNKENLETQQLAQGLFFDKHIFVFKNFIESKKEVRDYVLNNLEKFKDSNHLYIILENEIEEKYLSNIKSLKDVNIKEFNIKGIVGISKKDIDKKKFDLAASIMVFKSKNIKNNEDKVRILNQINDIKKYIDAPEEFFGILWWRYKKYASNDMKNMRYLIDIYHNAHEGEEDMWTGLERWLIS